MVLGIKSFSRGFRKNIFFLPGPFSAFLAARMEKKRFRWSFDVMGMVRCLCNGMEICGTEENFFG